MSLKPVSLHLFTPAGPSDLDNQGHLSLELLGWFLASGDRRPHLELRHCLFPFSSHALLEAVVLSSSASNILAMRSNLSSFLLEENNVSNIIRNQFCLMKRSVPLSACPRTWRMSLTRLECVWGLDKHLVFYLLFLPRRTPSHAPPVAHLQVGTSHCASDVAFPRPE